MLTARQRAKIGRELRGLIGPMTSDTDAKMIIFCAQQVSRQTEEEVEFCRHDVRGRP